jgi:hypothetical protein
MNDLAGMTVGELEEHLSKLRADLEEVEEERGFVLGQTGVHLSVSEVRRFESEILDLGARIEEVEEALRSRSPQ